MKYTVDSIIFDFDGVILESNHVRTEGFKLLLEGRKYDADTVARFIRFHEKNAGLSRYYKLRHLFYEILKQEIDESVVSSLCKEYSSLVKQKVANCEWVKGTEEFLKNNYLKYNLFIVSGSDQDELRDICRARSISKFFKEILGSPIDKKSNTNHLISKYLLNPCLTIFIGDSINDFEAAQSVSMKFIARDSGSCREWHKGIIIKDLSSLHTHIKPLSETVR